MKGATAKRPPKRRQETKLLPPTNPARWPRIAAPCAILVAGALAYSSSFSGQFIMDDQLGILINGRIRQLWPLGEFFKDTRPVADYTLALNYALSGLSPWGFHAVNLLIHLLAALVLYGVVRRTLLVERFEGRFERSAHWIAGAVALLWVLHPLNTQAVTYIIQRAESLMAMFYLLTLYCLVRGASVRTSLNDPTLALPLLRGGNMRRIAWYLGAVIACALGMGSKAVMVTVPVVAFLYDVIFISRSAKESLRRRWLLYLGFCSTVWVLWRVGVIGGLYLKDQGNPITVGFAMEGLTPWQYALTQPGVILHYLWLSLWPDPLCIDYGWPVAERVWEILPGALCIAVLLAATAWALVKRPVIGFLAASFFLILAPTSSIVPIKDIAFEHRMYLPLACVIIMSIALVLRGLTVLTKGKVVAHIASGCIVAAVALALGVATYERNALYGEPVELWTRNVALTPTNPRPINALGFALYKKKRNVEALAMLQRATELDPFYAGAYANIGMVHWGERNAADSVKYFRKALEISPFEFGAELYYCYGSALMAVGALDEAIKALRDAVECEPEYYEAQYNLGNAYAAKGLREEAIAAYRAAVSVNPRYTEAYVNLGLALTGSGRIQEAQDAYRSALGTIAPQTAPDVVFKAHYNLGKLLSNLGRTAEARQELTKALFIKPDHSGAQSALQVLPPI